LKTESSMTKDKSGPDDIWVISTGRYVDLDLSSIGVKVNTKTVVEYKVSDLARYLLNPNPIHVSNTLIGCEIHYHQPEEGITERIRKILPQKLFGPPEDRHIPPEVLLSEGGLGDTPLKDVNLESHFAKISESLAPFDPVVKRLSELDPSKISDVIGMCRDAESNLSYLNIKGDIAEKVSYIKDFLMKNVGVILEKAHISDGLFEMKGFDFESYDPGNTYRLVKFYEGSDPKAFLLGLNDTLEYWIDDVKLIQYLQLLDQLIRANPKLNDSLHLCRSGKAEPLKLFFNKQLEIGYSATRLPKIYREVLENHHIDPSKRSAVMDMINSSQLGVSFKYIPQSDPGEKAIVTHLSVMHNLRALEPIKDDLPHVYAEMNKMSSATETGKFYLLDSFRFKGDKNG
jgi:hypothetical protein